MLRIRQRSRRGTQTVCNVPKMCRKRFLVIPAIGHDGLVGSKVVEGTVNRKIFEKFLKPRVVSIYLSLIRMVTHLMVMWCSSRVWTGTQRLVAYWSWTMIPSTTEDTSLRCVSSKVAHSHLSPHLVKLSDTDWLVSGLVSQVFSSSTYHRTALSSTPSSWALGSWRWTFAGPLAVPNCDPKYELEQAIYKAFSRSLLAKVYGRCGYKMPSWPFFGSFLDSSSFTSHVSSNKCLTHSLRKLGFDTFPMQIAMVSLLLLLVVSLLSSFRLKHTWSGVVIRLYGPIFCHSGLKINLKAIGLSLMCNIPTHS